MLNALNVFEIFTGLATILGLFLQVRGSFPEYKEARQLILFLSAGLFLGVMLSYVLQAKLVLEVPVKLTGSSVLMSVAIFIILLFAVMAAFATEKERRDTLLAVTVVSVIFLGLILFWAGSKTDPLGGLISSDEYLMLSQDNAKRGNYQRAILFLSLVRMGLGDNDIRTPEVERMIRETAQKQLGGAKKTR